MSGRSGFHPGAASIAVMAGVFMAGGAGIAADPAPAPAPAAKEAAKAPAKPEAKGIATTPAKKDAAKDAHGAKDAHASDGPRTLHG